MARTRSCPERTQLEALIEGQLSEADQEALTEHVEVCPHCQAVLDTLRVPGHSWADVAVGLAQTPPAPAALEQVLEQARQGARPEETLAEDRTGVEELNCLAPSQTPGHLGRLDHYEIVEIIGQGGMGIVLKARDTALNRVVAIKIMAPALAATGTARLRFLREARAAASVRHVNCVGIHAVEEGNQAPYLVMHYVPGISLHERLERDGLLDIKEVLRVGMQIAEGLAAAHSHGLVHRDIKPANILLENGTQTVKITDFGLARAADDAALTQSGVVAGTPMYMAPEQALAQAVDHRADLFSLGSVLYTMCTGQAPFRSGQPMAVLRRVCGDVPRPIREIRPEVPAVLAALISRLHEKDPARRCQSAQEVAEELRKQLASLQRADTITMKNRPPAQRARRRWAALALIAILAGGAAILTSLLRDSAEPSPQLEIEPRDVTKTSSLPVAQPNLDRNLPVVLPALIRRHDFVSVEPWKGVKLNVHVYGMAFSPDGQYYAAAGDAPDMRVWRVDDGREVSRLDPQIKGWAGTPFWLADSKQIVSMMNQANSKDLYVWQAMTGKLLGKLSGHTQEIIGFNLSADRSRLLSWAKDKTVRIWDPLARQELKKVEFQDDPAGYPFLSADGKRLFMGDSRTIRIWDVDTGKEIVKLEGHTAPPQVRPFADGSKLVTWAGDQTIRVWDAATGKQLHCFTEKDLRCQNIHILPDNRQLISVIPGVGYQFWDLEKYTKGKLLTETTDHYVFHPDGRRLCVARDGGSLRVLDLITGMELVTYPVQGTDRGITFSPDGHLVVTGSFRRGVYLFRLPTASAPFALLSRDRKAESRHPTLDTAVAAARSGDTIEVHGDGPYVLQPLRTGLKSLTIRAGQGFRPVFKRQPGADAQGMPLLHADAPLVLEGLELQNTTDSPICRVGSSLLVSHCRLTQKGFGFGVEFSGASLELRNTEIICDSWTALSFSRSGAQSAVIEHCILIGYEAVLLTESSQPGVFPERDVRIHHSTLISLNTGTLNCRLYWPVQDRKAELEKRTSPPVRVHLERNLLDVMGQARKLRGPLTMVFMFDTARHRTTEFMSLMPAFLRWVDKDNVYGGNGPFITFFNEMGKELPYAAEMTSLLSWQRFWKLMPEGSFQVPIQYSGKSLDQRLVAGKIPVEAIHPADFRLARGSPGPGGKDLGADVDRVGPGAAYEAWKQTPAYKDWQNKIESLMSGK
jgi:serine/threonine protein kinase/WD40 repeat protein